RVLPDEICRIFVALGPKNMRDGRTPILNSFDLAKLLVRNCDLGPHHVLRGQQPVRDRGEPLRVNDPRAIDGVLRALGARRDLSAIGERAPVVWSEQGGTLLPLRLEVDAARPKLVKERQVKCYLCLLVIRRAKILII